ncbi:MAG TPA: Spy/CpxP family protein refolding chaperone [Stellaceae bacterium]|nr:Spy/CpxP family protein refolding chaperone [Stellaceae bacterium]
MSDRSLRLAAALAALLGGASAIVLPAAAQQSPPPSAAAPAAPGQEQQRPPRAPRPNHIEGRLAYLKTELHITPAQEAQWSKVADAMRQNSVERRQAFDQMRQARTAPPNALQRLETVSRLSAMRSQQTDRLLAAFRPLYDTLSDQQKQAANDIFGPHGHRSHFHHRG